MRLPKSAFGRSRTKILRRQSEDTLAASLSLQEERATRLHIAAYIRRSGVQATAQHVVVPGTRLMHCSSLVVRPEMHLMTRYYSLMEDIGLRC